MHLKFILSLLCLYFMGIALPTQVTAQTFEEIYAQIVQEARLQNYQNAIALSERILPQAEIKLGENTLNLSNFLNSLAGFYEQMQQPSLALPLYEQVLAIRTKVLPTQHPEYLKSIHKLANVYFVLGNYKVAKQTYLLVFKANSAENPLPSTVMFNAYSNLGSLYYHERAFAKADSLYEISKSYLSQLSPADTSLQLIYWEKKIQLLKSLEQYEKILTIYEEIQPLQRAWYGQTHPYYLQALYQKMLYCKQLKMYARIISVYESMPEVLWQQIFNNSISEGYAVLLESSYAYLAQENTQEAAKVLKFFDKNFASLPPTIAGRYWHLQALLKQNTQENTTVSRAFQQSVQAYQSTAAVDSAKIIEAYYDWAIWEDTQKNYLQAQEIWQILYTQFAANNDKNASMLLYNLATTYYKNGQSDKAIPIYETAYTHQLVAPSLKALIFLQLARIAEASIKIQQACDYYQKARSIWELNLNDLPDEYYQAGQEEAQLYQKLTQYPKAVDLLQQLLAKKPANAEINLRSQLAMTYYLNGQASEAQNQYGSIITLLNTNRPEELEQLIYTFNNLGNIYKNQGLYEEASTMLTKAKQLCDAQSAIAPYLKMLTSYNLANLWRSLGRLDEAGGLLNKTAEYVHTENPKTKALLLEVQLSQANLTRQKGQFAQAEVQYISVLSTLENQQEFTALHQEAQRQIALLYLQTGRYEKAVERLETLAKQNEEILLNDLSNELASAYQKIGRSTEAEALLISMIEIRTKKLGTQHPDMAAAQDQLGQLYRQRGNFEEARKLFESAYQNRLSALGSLHPAIAISKNHLALVAEQQLDFAQAETLYLQSLMIIKEKLGEDHLFYMQALNNLATLYEKNNAAQKAFSHYQAALARLSAYVHQNIGILSEQEKRQFWEANQTLINNFLSFVAKVLSQPNHFENLEIPLVLEELLNLRLYTKGLLLNHTRKMQSDFVKQADSQTRERYQQWQANREWLAHHLQKKPLPALQMKIDSLQKATESLEKELIIQSQDFAPLFIQKIHDWKAIQKKLNSQEAAIEMIRLPEQNKVLGYVALIILPEQKAPIVVLLTEGTAMESNYWSVYKNSIRFQEKDMTSYKRYWQEIQTVLDQAQTKKLYFSADGIYHLISLSALYISHEERYLDEKMTIVQLTNLQDLITQRPSKLKNASVSLWGRPSYSLDASTPSYRFKDLPFTELEVTQIATLLKEKKWKVALFTGKDARELVLKESVKPTILHLATHGYFEEQVYTSATTYTNTEVWIDPLLQSGLVWAGVNTPSALAQQEDGKLTALEVSQLALYETALVVLSACQTGLGKVDSGEGVYGLQRAFQVAGARQLLMSLWEVDDQATQQFMTFFYENLLKTQSSTEALRAARTQTRMLYPNPYYWAAFVLLGQ